jgi:hypothetical protein
MAAEEAIVRIGLETQFFAPPIPPGGSPVRQSPVHFAGEVHKNGLKGAVESCLQPHKIVQEKGGS